MNNSKKVLITTVPFGEKNSEPIELLESNDIEYVIKGFFLQSNSNTSKLSVHIE